MNELDIKKYETAIEETPEEVRKFLWSDEFKRMVEELAKYFLLDEQKRQILETIIFENIIGFISKDESEKELLKLGLDEDKKEEITTYIYEYFIEPNLVKTLRISELEKNEEGPEEKAVEAPTPIQALASIRERLSQSSSITSTKRDYSVERPAETTSSSPNTPKPIFDIYREPPTK